MERPRLASIEDPLRLAVFISGSGSGMEALIRHQQSQPRPHYTEIVISNKPDVKGLERASSLGVKSIICQVNPSLENPTLRRIDHEERLLEILREHQIELVILSGYMRLLSPVFIKEWEGRLLNIHPSLLPKYPGAHAHRDALADGATLTGCTVHLVDEGMDSGEVLAQKQVEILPDDDEEKLSERVKIIEHELYPVVIDAYSQGRSFT